MGALGLASLCKGLEEMGRSDALDGAEACIDAAAAAYEDVAAALREHVQI
jgi:hypothetical protein